jgi:NADH dehydrogenase
MTIRTVVVLGGTGFVGTELAGRLAARGDLRLRLLTRDPARARHLAVLPGVELVRGNVHEAAVLRREFAGADAVVNLVGILNESGFSGRGFERAHADLAEKVVATASYERVPRLVHMSSLGAAEDGPSHYLRSKGRAEAHLRRAPAALQWTILRPSVIFGAQDSLTRRFASLLRLSGGVLPLARAGARLQPIHVGDVARAFEIALDGAATRGQSYDLGGPEVMTLRELVERVGAMAGTPARVIPLPDSISRVQAFLMDFVPGRPFSTDNYRSLSVDSVCREDGCARLGIRPVALGTLAPGWLGGRERNKRLARLRASGSRAA